MSFHAEPPATKWTKSLDKQATREDTTSPGAVVSNVLSRTTDYVLTELSVQLHHRLSMDTWAELDVCGE